MVLSVDCLEIHGIGIRSPTLFGSPSHSWDSTSNPFQYHPFPSNPTGQTGLRVLGSLVWRYLVGRIGMEMESVCREDLVALERMLCSAMESVVAEAVLAAAGKYLVLLLLAAAGAVGGAMAIMEFMPPQYKHMLVGPSLKVDQYTGAIAEGGLTFLISFAALLIIQKGPKNVLLQTCLLSVSTMSMIVAGSGYTGPSMNPVNAFGWAYLNKSHNTWEQYYVYWICPFIGAILAAWVFRFIFPPPVKQKKA